jgi:DNA-binding transcriptional regulator YiaG
VTRHRLSFFARTHDFTTPPNGAQNFGALADQTQLSVRALAHLLRVRPDTILHWRKGRREAPPGVLVELRAYLAGLTNA